MRASLYFVQLVNEIFGIFYFFFLILEHEKMIEKKGTDLTNWMLKNLDVSDQGIKKRQF